ncbi:hypothetical protein [Amycolatopsis cihanbeyliensis]|uniref:Small secreted protein n=1 Tax=Amycolatopsis cihanbeyliensis TaxID=1128664 RepID=A0A542DNB7_AMYCI|nr:hypothetical protein [Amycolatopsis cihanbeyliensis]TQJ04475.1 hypothetical protein FB471_4271 [Amycolatopsis cihanbeyliensis]
MRYRVGSLAACLAILLTGCSDDEITEPPTGTPAPSETSGPSTSAPDGPASGRTPSGGATPENETDAADEANVAWMNDFCGALTEFATLSGAQAPDIAPGDIAAAKRTFSDMLGRFDGALGTAVTKLGALPPSPVPEGDTKKQELLDRLGPVRQQISDARSKLDAARGDDQQALIEAVGSVQEASTALAEIGNPLGLVDGIPALRDAGRHAPNCADLQK